jgi:hypothetical protein
VEAGRGPVLPAYILIKPKFDQAKNAPIQLFSCPADLMEPTIAIG